MGILSEELKKDIQSVYEAHGFEVSFVGDEVILKRGKHKRAYPAKKFMIDFKPQQKKGK